MATLLYEELNLEATATTEQIRKAYKKAALQTHPDRLPPTASAEQKKEAEERFRNVNHAYEVLSDPQKRKEYDMHGVWPPPVEDIPRSRGTSYQFPQNGFDEFLFTSQPHHHDAFRSFAFTDPFSLFNSIFGDIRPQRSSGFGFGAFEDPFERIERELNRSGFSSPRPDPFSGFMGSPRATGLFPGFSMFGMLPMIPNMQPASSPNRGGGQWVSESYMTQSINGVTQTIQTRVDAQGNEHVTRTLPDGRETYTVNGVEQASPTRSLNGQEQRRISASDKQRAPQPQLVEHNHIPPKIPPPPPYTRNRGLYNNDANYASAYPSYAPAPPAASPLRLRIQNVVTRRMAAQAQAIPDMGLIISAHIIRITYRAPTTKAATRGILIPPRII
ncbi:hypothetical protein D9611_006336 [Ephemerocybe angulata]|uniref:J domain-containing protein n=1 Tax=Ephemerocybe angulata TaxID=980116 RepID=A0A8H5FGY3_9AGAR|nr:hypothetical protein D9611_006336 [Tulosesus angulatus]